MHLHTTNRATASPPRLRTGRLLTRLAPWAVSLSLHGLLAASAAVTVIATVAAPPRQATATGVLLSAEPIERVTSARPGAVGGGALEARRTMAEVAREGEGLRSVPNGSRTALVDLDRPSGAAAELGQSGIYGAPRSSLFGAGGNASHVVYVIDRSGSMIETFDDVRRAVLMSIGRLGASQDFHAILFAEGKAIESAPRRLVPPTEASKLAAAAFLAGARPGFQSDPLPALSRAFDVLDAAKGGGKLIYLLSDGALPDGPAVLALIQKRNADKHVQINTYCCAAADAQGRALLRQIAICTGGLYRQVVGGRIRSGDDGAGADRTSGE